MDKPLLYQPDDAMLGNWYSPLNGNSEEFKGTHPFEGVNPANGVVIYYHLPESVNDSTALTLEIRDEKGELVKVIKPRTLVTEPEIINWIKS